MAFGIQTYKPNGELQLQMGSRFLNLHTSVSIVFTYTNAVAPLSEYHRIDVPEYLPGAVQWYLDAPLYIGAVRTASGASIAPYEVIDVGVGYIDINYNRHASFVNDGNFLQVRPGQAGELIIRVFQY